MATENAYWEDNKQICEFLRRGGSVEILPFAMELCGEIVVSPDKTAVDGYLVEKSTFRDLSMGDFVTPSCLRGFLKRRAKITINHAATPAATTSS